MVERSPLKTVSKKYDQVLHELEKKLRRVISVGDVNIMGHLNRYVPVWPTLIPSLDLELLGIGGIPVGQITEMFGPESVGKTTVAMQISAVVLKRGGRVLYIDGEHALSPQYCAQLGVDPEKIIVVNPDTFEEGANAVSEWVRICKEPSLVVIDTIASLEPEADSEKRLGRARIGLQASLTTEWMRKIKSPLSKSQCALLVLNQVREKIGAYVPTEGTPCGRALKHYASIRLRLRRQSSLIKDKTVVGIKLEIFVSKHKYGPPFRRGSVNVYFGKGVDRKSDFITVASIRGCIKKRGGWYIYNGKKVRESQLIKIMGKDVIPMMKSWYQPFKLVGVKK